MKRAWSKSNIPPFTFTHSNVTHSEGSRHAAVQGSLFGALFYRLHIAPCAFIRGTAGPFHWRYNTTSFHWCLLVPLIGYKPLSGPWGTIVIRGELLWNPTDFFCCSSLGSCILFGASIVISGDGQNTDPQSKDYPNGLLQWTTQMDYPKMDYP